MLIKIDLENKCVNITNLLFDIFGVHEHVYSLCSLLGFAGPSSVHMLSVIIQHSNEQHVYSIHQ